MQWRWPIENVNDINNHYFFGYSPQRSLMRNGISRLWWIGHLTYDETRQNKYELTEFLTQNSDYISSVLERNFSNNKKVVKALLSALVEAKNTNINVDRDLVREISSYVVKFGGIYLVDLYEQDELTEKFYERIIELDDKRNNDES